MTREKLKDTMLLAMSEHHSGNAAEARRIVDAQLAALEAAGVRMVNFTALAEDDAAVERIRKAISESQANSDEGPFESMYDLLSMSENNVHIVTREAARAAIRAMGGE